MLEGTLSVYAFIVIFPLAVIGGLLFLIRNFIRSTEYCDADARFDGKTIVVTGGSSGLGRTLAAELCKRGARVIVACRTKARRDSTAYFLRSKTGSFNLRTMFMDLNSLDSVFDFCQDLVDTEERIDAIVNNAATLEPQDKTSDDLDKMIGVNYIGHFLLTNLLCDKLLKHGNASNPARIINVVCGSFRSGHILNMDEMEGKFDGSYNMRNVYRSTKLALHLMTKELAHKYVEEGVVAYSVDPGYVNTGLYRHLEGPFGKFNQTCAKALYRTTEEGMQTILYCLSSKDVLKLSGSLFKDCRVCDVRNSAWTENSIKDLWTRASELILSKGIKLELGAADEEEEEADKADNSEQQDSEQ
ncbi:retinol dehydrogenase 14-like [Argiope bruennichi]|uniref:Retinol dehydrogenase 14 like protein n=1 Tax=Argiope bruennichi TaxID=94029 RepID=A0A8T0F260_ARGBR|nr:retinol dehydrogenase 14-like [Argiope bruennichi]KAF8783059.1 Retinol dehydrogenase 14 like protein [Argiope bruennichi]